VRPVSLPVYLHPNLVEEGDWWHLFSLRRVDELDLGNDEFFEDLEVLAKFGVWAALWPTTWQVGHLAQTWRVRWPLVDSEGSTIKVVDVSTITHEGRVAEAVDYKIPLATIILIESEAPVSPEATLTGKHCVYIDSCVYRVIVLGFYRSHWVYICVYMYIIKVLSESNTAEGVQYGAIEEHNTVRGKDWHATVQARHTVTAGKWRKYESYFRASTLWLAAGAGHELDGSAPHQCRRADVVLAPRCRDCLMVCCRVWSFFHWPFVSSWTVTLIILRLGLCSPTAALFTAAFPPIFLQLRKGPLWSCAELLQNYALFSFDQCTVVKLRLPAVRELFWGMGGRGDGGCPERYWCFRKLVQWNPCIVPGGAKCGLIASNERDVQSFLRLHRLLARSLPRHCSRLACMRSYVHFVCVCVYMCMCACVRTCI